MKKMSLLFVFFIASGAAHTHSMQQPHTLAGRVTVLTADKLTIQKPQQTTAMLISKQSNASQNAISKKIGGRSLVPSTSSKKIYPLVSDVVRATAEIERHKLIDTEDNDMPGAIFDMEL